MKIVSRLSKIFIFAFLLVTTLGIPSLTARAAVTLQVTTTADSLSSDGACSLREAITAANTNATVNECVHDGSSGADTITFAIPDTDTGCSEADVCTITLGSTLPAINDELTIDGIAQDITVSGNDSVRVMMVNSGKTLRLEYMTITKAKVLNGVGAGIYNNGSLYLANSLITKNVVTGSGSAGGGLLSVSGSTVNIDASAITENKSETFGGGMAIYGGTVNVTNSLIAQNGACCSTPWGGGIYNNHGLLTITNSTIASNYGNNGGGVSNDTGGTLTVTQSTIAYNSGGGIHNQGNSATLRNSLFIADSGSHCYNASGALIADSHNLISSGRGSCDNATIKTIDELALATSLADNGGATQTLAIGTNSAAIDAGDDTVCAATVGAPNYGAGGKDQRDITRPQGIKCDVGSFEREIAYLTVIKHVDNSSGGSAVASQWTMNVSGMNPSQTSFPGAESPGVKVILDAGAYSVTESNGPSGYQENYSTDCSGTIAFGESKTCTITNIQFTPTPTNTPTNTPTFTATFTPTNTPTNTATFTPTYTPTNTPTFTATFTPTNTPTRTNTFTPSTTPSRTNTPTNTATFTPTRTPTNTATFTPTYTPTKTATVTTTPTSICDVTKPAKPTLRTPIKGVPVPKTRPTLKWYAATCAKTYTVTIKDAVTGKKVDSKKGLTVLQYKTKTLTRGKTYTWQVTACNEIGCTRSEKRSLTVAP